MGNANAKAQAAYRGRQVRAGAHRLSLFISAGAATAIRAVAEREGMTQREVIERLALIGAVDGKGHETENEDGKN